MHAVAGVAAVLQAVTGVACSGRVAVAGCGRCCCSVAGSCRAKTGTSDTPNSSLIVTSSIISSAWSDSVALTPEVPMATSGVTWAERGGGVAVTGWWAWNGVESGLGAWNGNGTVTLPEQE